MTPERVDFWGISQPWGPALIYLTLTLSLLVMIVRLVLQSRYLFEAEKREMHAGGWSLRWRRFLSIGLLQLKTLRERYPGAMHLALSLSFFLLFMGTVLATLNGHFIQILRGYVYLIYKLVLDLASIGFLFGVGMAVYRRQVLRPRRLTLSRSFLITLGLLSFIVVNGLFVEALRLSILQPWWAGWAPVGWLGSQLWIATGLGEAALHGWHQFFYVLHVLSVSAFFITLPDTNLVHMFSAPLNIFFSDPNNGAQLLEMSDNQSGKPLYARQPRDLGWKQLLDGEACTECGRCQDACPAYAAGLPLNPKEIILSVRDTARGRKNGAALPGQIISEESLWACMACGACMESCPVMIGHLDTIIDLRRSLVYDGKVDLSLQAVLSSLQKLGNSEGQPRRERCSWVRQLPFTIKDATREPVEYLWLVGDHLGYNEEMAHIAVQTAQVFHTAGLDFGILYSAEENDGNDLRRVGEEGLYQELVRRNCQSLQKSDFQVIVTTDPHLFNTFKHEYPAEVLMDRPVLHYTTLLEQLFAEKRLSVARLLDLPVTYHDPCYLGRFNEIVEAPRSVLNTVGCKLVEMAHCGGETICCGAGGGYIWMREGQMQQRPTTRRIEEALALEGVGCFVVTCPKDWIMYHDAAQDLPDGRLDVKDLIELVHSALGLKNSS